MFTGPILPEKDLPLEKSGVDSGESTRLRLRVTFGLSPCLLKLRASLVVHGGGNVLFRSLRRSIGRYAALRATATGLLLLFAAGLSLVLQWTNNHDHISAIDARAGLYDPDFRNVLCKLFQQTNAHLWALLLTTTELDHGLDLVACAQEAQCVADLGFIVVGVDLQTEANFLQNRIGLVLPGFTRLDGRLVLVLAEVHQLAHWRLGVRGHLDQVQIGLVSQAKCVLNADNSYLFTVRANETYLWYANALVNAWIADV